MLRRQNPTTVIVLQLAMGAYRQGFLDAVERATSDVQFSVGDEHFNRGVVTAVDSPLVVHTGANYFSLGRRVAFQRNVLRSTISAGVLVVEANPRTLNSWLAIAIRRLLGRPTVGWGHANPRAGAGNRSAQVRRFMQRKFAGYIAYTASEASELRSALPRSEVFTATNALYSSAEMTPVTDGQTADSLVLIGRLVEDKKPLLALRAFAAAQKEVSSLARLHVVGGGPLEHEVRAEADALGIKEKVVFHGTVSDIDQLREVFARAKALLATGYIGLNATQSLGFGVPVIYPDDEPHAPEIEALNAGNSICFKSGDARSCASAIKSAFSTYSFASSNEISRETRERYSTEQMAGPFVDLARRLHERT